MSHQFLLEVLCEEIPANALLPARKQLADELVLELAGQSIACDENGVVAFTSRRLIV